MDNKSKFWMIFGSVLFLMSLVILKYASFMDDSINIFFNAIGLGFLIKFAEVISYITDPIVLAGISGILLIILLFTKRYRQFFVLGIGIGGGILIELLLKALFQRGRPENILINEVSFSFPSGHAMISVIFFGLFIYLFKDEIKNLFWKKFLVWICVLAVFVICLSRLYLNVHWFSDVLGGIGIGLVWVMSVIVSEKAIRN